MKTFTICAVLPFWRYAVCPTNGHSPGVPFYREAAARAFFEDTKRHLPWAGCLLVKHLYFRGVEVIEEYDPHKEWVKLPS